jgi:flavin reductase (DIM6/NTAB) family NADH-FMN oxidoreductase RutF
MVSEELFKSILSCYATSVTVVTVHHDDKFAGLTVSSFCSVSLSPPLVLISIENEARTNTLLKDGADFTVNLLNQDQETVSQQFAEPGLSIDDRLENISYSLPSRGGPILTESLAWLICEQYETCDGGDHTIYVGEIIEGQKEAPGDPLLYYQGEYGSFEG